MFKKHGDRYDVGVNRRRIGSRLWAIYWHRDLSPWMTFNRHRPRSQNFRISYISNTTRDTMLDKMEVK